MKIYAASSWRNELQPSVVEHLRAANFQVYDFRHPAPDEHGFSWSEIDPNWQSWTAAQFRDALKHPVAVHGLKLDFDGMNWADVIVMVQPCGRSAALELGWAIGAGKRTIILLAEKQEPELMFALADTLCLTMDEVIADLRNERLPLTEDGDVLHGNEARIFQLAKSAIDSDINLLPLLMRLRSHSRPSTIDKEAVAQILVWQQGRIHSAVKALETAEAAFMLSGDRLSSESVINLVRAALTS
jgi:hypothetical protein